MASVKSNREESKIREDKIAGDLGGRSVVMSGGLWFKPGDVDTGKLLIEDKFTWDSFYSLKHTLLLKIQKQAVFKRRIPIFSIELNHRTSLAFHFVVIPSFYVLDESAANTDASIDVAGKSIRLKYDTLFSLLNKHNSVKLNFLDKNNDLYLIVSYDFFLLNYKKLVLDTE